MAETKKWGFEKTHKTKRELWKNGYWIVERSLTTNKITTRSKWSSNKLKRDKAYNKVKNKRKDNFFKEKRVEFLKTQPKEKEQTAWQQLKLIELELKKYPNVSLYTNQVKKENVKNFKINIKSGGRINKSKLLKEYKRILKGKIVRKDQFENIYIHRKKVLKHRLMMKINIYTKIGYVGSIEIGNILLEDEVKADKFWIGQYVDSQNFPSLAEEFRNYMPPTNIYVVNHDGKGAGIVTRLDTTWSIA